MPLRVAYPIVTALVTRLTPLVASLGTGLTPPVAVLSALFTASVPPAPACLGRLGLLAAVSLHVPALGLRRAARGLRRASLLPLSLGIRCLEHSRSRDPQCSTEAQQRKHVPARNAFLFSFLAHG
jgi:hypothetical protein